MKAVFSALVLVFGLILTAAPVSAHAEPCLLTNAKVSQDISGDLEHTKTMIRLLCTGEEDEEEMVTKLVYKIEFTDIQNFEASDELGTLKVLEGPEYATATVSGKEATIGVILRKPLFLSEDESVATINFDYDSDSLTIPAGENAFAIKPGKLIGNPKITIVSRGVTEAILPLEKLDYELLLPKGATVQTLPQGCSINSGVILCEQISKGTFESLEIKWNQPESVGKNLLEKIRSIFSKADKTAEDTGLVDKLTDTIRKLIK